MPGSACRDSPRRERRSTVRAADRDLVDGELDGIELHGRGRRERGRAERRGATDRALDRIDLEHERDVLDIDDAIGRELRSRTWKCELAGHLAGLYLGKTRFRLALAAPDGADSPRRLV
jgi:hypothetical protein